MLYVRGDELNYLQTNAGSLAESDRWFKRSNEQYFRFVSDTVNYPFRIKAGPDASARLDASYTLAPGLFFSHFPYSASVQWLASSSISIRDDHFDPANSYLNTTTNVALFQYLGCLDSAAGCPPNLSFTLHHLYADGSRLYFTPDGGLEAQGALNSPTQLKWGEFNNGEKTRLLGS